jgi:predicted component of viral defense system (DUF524 family)
MQPVAEANIPIIHARGVAGHVAVSLLPNQRGRDIGPPLIEKTLAGSLDLEPSIQLLEESEYRYQINIEGLSPQSWSTDRPELFQPDTVNGRTGRVRTGSYTGWLPVTIFRDGNALGNISLEVRSRKLNYLNEYQWMMRDLAEALAEIVMYYFAATEQRFSIDDTRDAVTLYQRFAFLRSLIASDGFTAAIREIIKRPHVSWEQIHEEVQPGQGMKGTSSLVRQIAKAGQRSPWLYGPVATVPHKLDRLQTEATVDTTPNRFVKFALTRWRGVVSQISEILRQGEDNPARKRGTRETSQVLDQFDSILSEELFREVGPLYRFPADDQVLQKREGYREILRAYIQFEVASKLAWSGGEDVYGAGQRDVATLYEYWVFLKLGQVISDLCDAKFDFSSLIEVQKDRLNVSLRRGKAKVFTGTAVRLGRELTIELWFNRTYSSSKLVGSESSWSEQMRPDYTLRISAPLDRTGGFEPVLLHFDAKYRLQVLEDLFGRDSKHMDEYNADKASEHDDKETALRSDLLKMHAYRDAIRRSAGAYVIYPGTQNDNRREYHELLPGLGAFALRPTETGTGDGTETIKEFITDVFDHVASQITQHERGRFWLREVFERSSPSKKRAPTADFLVAPPADTTVLLGYVKNAKHWEWIEKTHNYNLRADVRRGSVGLNSKELGCDLVLLYCPELRRTSIAQIIGIPQLRTREEMLASGYPTPRGNQYYCMELALLRADRWQTLLTCEAVKKISLRKSSALGAPVATTWFELIVELA